MTGRFPLALVALTLVVLGLNIGTGKTVPTPAVNDAITCGAVGFLILVLAWAARKPWHPDGSDEDDGPDPSDD